MTANVSLAALQEIEKQRDLFDSTSYNEDQLPTIDEMINSVLAAQQKNDLERRTFRADLYVLANDGTEYFFEIKSPKPN